ncbi:hypothetical protein HMPREF1983_01026 [Gemella bergeri ATCC 700627]|uniref:Uncharacterized protein n=1 Tax=Gemella bergeri ATCC 700627 TaxID=1321820 RepID=U2QMF6_9BACL|nr:hypothetical protein [Gemella bergeri]ERK57701.1 hypothetical protein HMPREF1983_01026 [Gemella bergeri ATCC 700627]
MFFKFIFEKHNRTIREDEKTHGDILIQSTNGDKFILSYKYSLRNKVFNFRETKYNYTLFRVNLNNSFHKNANGEKIKGNRINIFSEQEYLDKNDGQTYYKAYSLPFNEIKNTDDFIEMLDIIIKFSNTDKNDNLTIRIQENLI